MHQSGSKSENSADPESSSSGSPDNDPTAATNVTITVETPSKNNKRTTVLSGDDVIDVPCNLGSDENLLASDALNEESQNQEDSHFKNNLGNWSPNLQLHETANNSINSIGEAGLSLRNGFTSLQVPFSFGRSSKDADSICTAQSHIMGSDYKFDPTVEFWWKHPKVRENWRVFFAAFGLLLIGTGLLVMGIVVTAIPEIDFQSYVFFIAGAFCFIPGAYHVVYVYCAVKGMKGYDFYQLPLFN